MTCVAIATFVVSSRPAAKPSSRESCWLAIHIVPASSNAMLLRASSDALAVVTVVPAGMVPLAPSCVAPSRSRAGLLPLDVHSPSTSDAGGGGGGGGGAVDGCWYEPAPSYPQAVAMATSATTA